MRIRITIIKVKESKHQLENHMVVFNQSNNLIKEIIIKVEVKSLNNKIFKNKNFQIFLKKKFLIKENIKKKILFIFLKVFKQLKVVCNKKILINMKVISTQEIVLLIKKEINTNLIKMISIEILTKKKIKKQILKKLSNNVKMKNCLIPL